MSKVFKDWIETKEKEDEAIRYTKIVNQNTESDLQVSEAILNSLTPSVKHAPDEALYVLTLRKERNTLFHKVARGINVLFREPKKVSEKRLRPDMLITTKHLRFRNLIQVHVNLDLPYMQKA